MRDPVEAARGVDPLEGIRGGQSSRRDGGENRGAMLALHGVERFRRAFGLGERGAHFRGRAPPDRLGALAQRGLAGDGFADGRVQRMACLQSSAARRSSGPPMEGPGSPPSSRISARRDMVERVQCAGHSTLLGLGLRRLLQFGQEVPHLSSAAPAVETPGPARPVPRRARRRPRPRAS